MKRFLYILLISFFTFLLSCHRKDETKEHRDLSQILESDTLVVATLYGPISYFNYKENEMGYEYEFIKQLCKELKVELKLHVAQSLSSMLKLLETSQVDLVAYRVPYTEENLISYDYIMKKAGY